MGDPNRQIAIELVKRLLEGDREGAPLQLSMLLEKSWLNESKDNSYRKILPPELARITFSPELRDEVIAVLCDAIAHNPEEALLATLSFVGTEPAVRTMVNTLTHPPRPLTIAEFDIALSNVTKFLPKCLGDDPGLLPLTELTRLAHVVNERATNDESGVERSSIRHFAPQLLNVLTKFRVEGV